MGLKILGDRMSELPDEIISFILSLLPMRESARTSILSRRWRCLWKISVQLYRNISLDVLTMKGVNYSEDIIEKRQMLKIERSKFMGWVEQILQLDYSPVIDSFRLQFYLKKKAAHFIDQWIAMAIAKRVRNLDIDLSNFCTWETSCRDEYLYTFPSCLFTQEIGSLVKCLCLNSCNLGPISFHCFSSLLDLQLENVPINDDIVVKFLSSCPNLENLCLVNCSKLLSLKFSGPSLKLKYLTVVSCCYISKIKIDAKNLTRLEYCGAPIKFSFRNAPQLCNVTIQYVQGNLSAGLNYALGKLSSDLPKLESLFLSVIPIEEKKIPEELPLFENLKKLVLKITNFGQILWGFIPLIHASPYLHRLELHLFISAKDSEAVQRPADYPHLHLTEILLSGFSGTSHEIEFTRYLLSNCRALKAMTIDCEHKFYDHKSGFYNDDCDGESKEEVDRLAAIAYSEKKIIEERSRGQLENVVPLGVQLQFV